MTTAAKALLDTYMLGFDDELTSKTSEIPDHILHERAYQLGRSHAIISDDVTSIDYLSDEEVLDLIINSPFLKKENE